MGWRHFLAASSWSWAWSWPGPGGAAKSGPITLNRKCAQRSWDREVDDVSFIGCRDFYFSPFRACAPGFTPGSLAVSPGILCVSWGEPHITNSFQALGVVIGARNLSNSSSRSRRSTSKLRHNDRGIVL